MKRLGKAFVALATATAMGAAGFAGVSTAMADDNDATLTINGTVSGDQFAAYRLLDIESSAGCLTDVNVGVNPANNTQGDDCKIVYKLFDDEALNTAIRTAAKAADTSVTDETDLIKWLVGDPQDPDNNGQLRIDNIDKFAAAFTYDSATNTVTATGTTTSMSVPAGYYLIKHTVEGSKIGEGDTATAERTLSRNMVTTALAGQTVTITLKNDTVPVGKFLNNPDLNDGDNGQTDIASYAVGDTVEYVLTGGIPSNYPDFTSFIFKFTDTLDPGLTFKDDLKIYFLDGEYVAEDDAEKNLTKTDLSEATLVTYDDADKQLEVTKPNDGSRTLTVNFKDLKQYGDAVGTNTTIVVTYKAEVNENAEVTNNNGVKIDFSYDPYHAGLTIPTPTIITTVVSFTLTVDKTDGNGDIPASIADAEFTLYRLNVDDPNHGTGQSEPAVEADETTDAEAKDKGVWNAVGVVKNDEDNPTKMTATFENLSAGSYKLVETNVPKGYNKAEDIEFKIVADYDDQGSLVKLTVMDKDGRTELTDTFTVTNVSGTVADAEGGVLATTIKNVAGSQLPSTGGMGTMMLYIVGGLIVLAAVGGLTVAVRKRQN